MPTSATTYPTSSSNWTNSSNANSQDGVFATEVAARDLIDTVPPSYISTPTPNLLCQTFTGLNSGINAGDTITGITLKIKVKRSGSDTCTGTIYLARSGTKIGSTSTFSIDGTLTEYTFGGAGNTLGGTWVGSDLTSLQVVFFAKLSTGSTSSTVSVDSVSVSVAYTASTPSAFSFTDVTGATISTLYTSDTITVAGLGGGTAAVSLSSTIGSSGQYEKNSSGVWTSSAGTAVDGDRFRVRNTSSASANTAIATILTIGGVSDTYSVTTVGVDTTPSAFSWASLPGCALSSTAYATSYVTVAGINAAATISIAGASGQYRVNGGSWTSGSGSVNLGDTVEVRVTTSGSYLTGVTTTVTIGGVAGTFTATTRAADTTPDQFTWTDQASAATSTVYTSNTITVSGLEAAAALSFVTSGGTSHEYNLNGGGWVAVGSTTISNGQTLQVRMTSPGSSNLVGNIAVTIGGISDTYSVSTGADTTPDVWAFTDVTNAFPGVYYDHAAIVLSGLTPGVPVTATYSTFDGGMEINGAGGFVQTADVVNGDSIVVRARAYLMPTFQALALLTVGGVSVVWSVTTGPVPIGDF